MPKNKHCGKCGISVEYFPKRVWNHKVSMCGTREMILRNLLFYVKPLQ